MSAAAALWLRPAYDAAAVALAKERIDRLLETLKPT
jgi:hypothetical protein